MEKNEYIFGIRAVIEAIEAGRDIDRILVKKELSSELANKLFEISRHYDIPLRRVPIEKLNRISRKNHQGVIAILSQVTYYKLENIVPMLYEDGKLPFIVLLDGITDVRNFGAIARTCECAGVDAIVIPDNNSVGVNGDAVKTSAGALNYLPVCREHSILESVRFLKANGYKVVAADEKAMHSYTQDNYTDPVALVMGAEDIGISPEVRRQCDMLVSIPQFGNIGSLNVSVAAGVMIYEVVRQRMNADMEVR